MSASEDPYYTTISVSGMNCNHCKMKVEKNLLDLEGVEEVDVDLVAGTVTIGCYDLDLGVVSEKVVEIGYQYIGTL